MTWTDNYIKDFACHPKNWMSECDFDEWLESHDAEVRMDAIIARDTRTTDELLRAAWNAACPVPEERDASSIPADARIIWRMGIGHDYDVYVGIAGDMSADLPQMIAYGTVRTLAPLPPVIPDDCIAVWASTKDCDGRRVLVLSEEPIGNMLRHWRDGDGDEYRDEQLIDPAPIPKEER